MALFDKICEQNYERIYKYVLGMTGNVETAKDITQEVFLIAYQKGNDFLKHEKPEAFLYKTAKNLIMANYRKGQREIFLEPDENMVGTGRDVFEEICRVKEDSIAIEWYREIILEQLSTTKRQLYNMYYIEGKSMKEIAGVLGFNEFTLRMRYVRLRREIKEQVKELQLGNF